MVTKFSSTASIVQIEGGRVKSGLQQRSATLRPSPLVGAHMSIAGGLPRAIERALAVGANVLQIFVKNNHRWVGRSLLQDEVAQFRAERRRSGLAAVVAHASYLINLASPEIDLWEKSIQAMVEELERCRRLGLSHLIVHPGAHVGSGELAGVRRVASALDRLHQRLPDNPVRISLENTAGQGTCLGYRFEQLRDILAHSRYPERLAICLDTCHLFAAGYDLRQRSSYREMISEFDRLIGLKKLHLLHLNDSKRELGSRVDRHQHIGEGQIGEAGFAHLMRDDRFDSVPKIIETPKGEKMCEDVRNLRKLRSLSHNRVFVSSSD